MMVCGVNISELKGVTDDSRLAKDGFLFAAFPGAREDGSAYIDQALANGATHILTHQQAPQTLAAHIAWVSAQNPRRDFALIAAAFYGAQPAHLAAVTGTNGKTSVATFTAQIWQTLGFKSAALGTLGLQGAGISRSGQLTTPGTAALHETLAEVKSLGVEHLALEASSHGLAQHRLDGLKLSVAAFTNISRDHLDYHGDMAAYKDAKFRLFTQVLAEGGAAVLNADAPEFEALQSLCEARNLRVLSYGKTASTIKLVSATPAAQGQNLTLELEGQRYEVALPLAGNFQTMNALCAAAIVWAEYPERLSDIIAALQTLSGVPGRLQSIEGHPDQAGIYVDYAHTPDALETALKALRPHTSNRLICVFGCGGDRDKGKRPLMGAAAQAHADIVIVTDDNPRNEAPDLIRKEILAGTKTAQEIAGRREAIGAAIGMLTRGDVLVIAGKGHEQGQIFKDHTEPFDDAGEIRAALSQLSSQHKQ